MSRLVRVEVQRLLSRRAFGIAVGLLLVGAVAALTAIAINSNRDLAAAHAAAVQQALSLKTELARSGPAVCRSGGELTGGARQLCYPPARLFFQDPRFIFATQAPNVLTVAVAVLGVLGLILGATFIGAEWGAGTFSALLTWEPRRARVLAAKTFAVVAIVTVVSAIAIAVFLAGAYLVADLRGTTAGTTASVMHTVILRGLRGVALVALLTAVGTALAGLTRSSVGALGLGLGYVVGGELLLQRIHPEWARWLLVNNAQALFTNGNVLLPLNHASEGKLIAITGHPEVFALSPGRATLYLLIVVAVLLGASMTALVRRDAG